MHTKISVIIPVYNTKVYLKEAIGSILVQKDYIFEIIIVNDGSTDGSKELLEKLYGSNDMFKIIHTKNNGQGYARNIGTNLAKGDYIYYFDSDDIADKELFKSFFDKLNVNPKIELFCFSGESFLDQNLSLDEVSRPGELSSKAFKRKLDVFCDSGEIAFRLLVNKNAFTPVPWLYIFKKSILTDNNVRFSPIRYEDEEFSHKLFIYAGPTYITNKVFFYRRVRVGSTMQLQRTFEDFLGYFYTIKSLEKLKTIKTIELNTKQILNKRIETFVKIIIQIKTISNINLTKDQKKVYTKNLFFYLKKNIKLFVFYFVFPITYNLRKLKKKVFQSSK